MYGRRVLSRGSTEMATASSMSSLSSRSNESGGAAQRPRPEWGHFGLRLNDRRGETVLVEPFGFLFDSAPASCLSGVSLSGPRGALTPRLPGLRSVDMISLLVRSSNRGDPDLIVSIDGSGNALYAKGDSSRENIPTLR